MGLDLRGTHDVELLLDFRYVFGGWVEGGVDAGGFVPNAVQVVGHHVDEVQVLGQHGDVVGEGHGEFRSGDGGREEESVLVELVSQFFEELGVVLLKNAFERWHVGRSFGTYYVGWLTATLVGVFPVEIEAVETVFHDEFCRVFDELRPGGVVRDHVAVLGRAFVPSADGDEGFDLRVAVFQSDEPLERPLAPVLLQVVPSVQDVHLAVFPEADEGVNQVSAQRRIDLLDVELPRHGSINGPTSVVAHHAI